jgi:hypothetical protein
MPETQVNQVTVENVIDGAIIEGFKSGIDMFMESLEDALQRDVILTEAGGAENVFQQMINETQIEDTRDQLATEAQELQQKLASVIK